MYIDMLLFPRSCPVETHDEADDEAAFRGHTSSSRSLVITRQKRPGSLRNARIRARRLHCPEAVLRTRRFGRNAGVHFRSLWNFSDGDVLFQFVKKKEEKEKEKKKRKNISITSITVLVIEGS